MKNEIMACDEKCRNGNLLEIYREDSSIVDLYFLNVTIPYQIVMKHFRGRERKT